ncbi:hypothetical protein Q7P37_005520 [Cladosporium fusiforme]
MFMQHTKVEDDRSPAPDHVALIILTCALMIGRQKASTEASFTAIVNHGSDEKAIEVELEISSDSEIGSLVQIVLEQINSSRLDTLATGHDVEKRHEIKITICEGQWELSANLPNSHSGDFNGTFNHIFSQLASLPRSATISKLSMVRKTDIDWLLEHSSHNIDPPIATTGVAMFQDLARRHPDKLAVDAWDGSLTYAELDEQSTRLASGLTHNGVRPSSIVPLFFRFSKWVPISLLAVWKTGASWVFLDPSQPMNRLQALFERVQATVVITQTSFHAQLLELGVKVLSADEMITHKDAECSEHDEPTNLAEPHGKAYLIFTSGSTGEPKAVVLTHRALCSGVVHQAQKLGFSEEARTLQNCPLIFAGAIMEILFTLFTGGCLCMPTEEERLQDLGSCATRFQSNLVILASSSAAVREPRSFTTRHKVLIGAEPLSCSTIEKWAALHDSRNVYGSSETNVGTTCSQFVNSMTHKSVGKGAAHRYWIVDASDHNSMVPPGWLGEIVVEGHALASEYLGNEEATAKAFPSAPAWHAASNLRDPHPTRFYKTGDLGRIASDGSLEVHGRTDALQVKLRGQRIELGEIEAASLNGLSETLPLVAELILPKRQERPSIALFLVAPDLVKDVSATLLAEHVSLSEQQQQDLALLKAKLKNNWSKTLPAYMTPTYVVPLPALPRTATGKLDRRRLRIWSSEYEAIDLMAFAVSSSSQSTRSRPLTGDLEARLAVTVAKILNISPNILNAGSAYTTLGGDSLAAIQISNELRQQDLFVSPAEIIQSENLASLATRLKNQPSAADPSTITADFESDWVGKNVDRDSLLRDLAVAPDNVADILPTTDSQSRSIELGTGSENCFIFHFVLKFEKGLDLANLQSALQRLVDRHDTLRTLFTQKDDRILQIILKHLPCPLELRSLREESSIDDTVGEIAESKISLDQVPTQFWLLSKGSVPAALVMRLSHAQFDGISAHSLWESLAECYEQTTPAPAPDFATYARNVLHKDSSGDLAYFKNLLHGVPFTNLAQRAPQSGHFPQNRSFHQRLTLQPVPGFTMAHLFEASWGFVCAKSSKADAAVFDTIVSGRQLSMPTGFDIQKLVGACLNDVPVVVRFQKHQKVHQLLAQIRDQHMASAKHETLGFRRILGECKPADWPQDARMTSSVQYRGFEGDVNVQIGDTTCAVSLLERSMDLEDLTVVVTPSEDRASGQFDVEFLYSDKIVEERQAEKWFEELVQCVTALSLGSNLHQSVDQVFGRLDV